MPWEEALRQLTFEAEREWLRRARAAWQRVRGFAPPAIEEEEETPPTDVDEPVAEGTAPIAQPDEEPPIDIEPEE